MLEGVTGLYGPNDYGYMNLCIRRAAKQIQDAITLYCEGHYAHSNARIIPQSHPLVESLKMLKIADEQTCEYANEKHEEKLFIPYTPPLENQTRWDMAPVGVDGHDQ